MGCHFALHQDENTEDILNETSREVGFRHRPKDLNALIVIVADKLDSRVGGAL